MDFSLYFIAGAVAGLLSGLFGVGGGLIIVPILTIVFGTMAFPQAHIMHMALGTSLATIIFTSIASARAHHREANVDWSVVRRISLGIVIGTFLGTHIANHLATGPLKIIFSVFVFVIATQMWLDFRPNPARSLPGLPGMNTAGTIIGIVSSLVGIGGGSLSVPFMIYCNVAVKRAIGTSAAIGLPIAVSGALGFMLAGRDVMELPQYSLGYVYLPALVGIAVVSTMTAPLGARIARRIPATALKRAFAALLYLIGCKMLLEML
ncbi:MAG TPA: sulfite exporter TauE/SafE family protein [Methylophilaceae bacterium]|jgi:uncharacterized membrane protein YfcA